MSEKKWTPGPWTLTPLCEGAVVASEEPDLNLLGLDNEGLAIFISVHDAQLASAAPELYDALEGLAQEGKHDGDCDNDGAPNSACSVHIQAFNSRVQTALAVLAKARGDQP